MTTSSAVARTSHTPDSPSKERIMAKELDLSGIELEDLIDIHNQVLRQVAAVAKLNLEAEAAGHDSHGSNHSNNKIVDRNVQEQISRVARPQG